MIQRLEAAGFYLYDTCGCGGTPTFKYRHKNAAGVQFNIRPKRGSFEIFDVNYKSLRCRGGEFFNFEQKLNEIIEEYSLQVAQG